MDKDVPKGIFKVVEYINDKKQVRRAKEALKPCGSIFFDEFVRFVEKEDGLDEIEKIAQACTTPIQASPEHQRALANYFFLKNSTAISFIDFFDEQKLYDKKRLLKEASERLLQSR